MAKNTSIVYQLILFPIRCYQYLVSPLLGPCCRFHPSCSEYALDAIDKRGFFKGSFLTLWRLLRCHPFAKGGFDPIPTPKKRHTDGL